MSNFLNFKATRVGINTRARIGGRFTSFQAQALKVNEKAVGQMAKWAVEELDRHMRRPARSRSGTLERAILDPTTHRATLDGFQFMVAEEMDAKVVNPLRPKRGTYWAAIEYGSTASVGRILPLNFLDSGGRITPPNQHRAQKEIAIGGPGTGATSRYYGNDMEDDWRILESHRGLPDGAFVGGMDRYRYSRHRPVEVTIRSRSGHVLKTFMARRRPTIEVKNPIRPYHYAREAVRKFEAGDYAYYKTLLRKEADRAGLKLVFIGSSR